MNVSYSLIESNLGYGVVVWFNESSPKLLLNQEFIIAYNRLSLNKWSSVFVGNFCTAGSVNICGNIFNQSLWNLLEIQLLETFTSNPPDTNWAQNFHHNQQLGVVFSPVVTVNAIVGHNLFQNHRQGCLSIRNPDALELEALSSDVLVANNRFEYNSGLFVANLGLSQYGDDAQAPLY